MAALWTPYQEWFPYFKAHVVPVFAEKCQAAMNTPKTVDAWCETGAACIFDELNNYTQTQLAGAAVLLGLAPGIIGMLAPSDAALAFLSSERPLLSILLAASTATLSSGYPFTRVSPLQTLSDAVESVWSVDMLLPNHVTRSSALLSPLQYVLSAAAAANTIHMSYDITRKTIVSWSCPNWAWVICWSTVPAFLQLINMVIFRATVKRSRRDDVPALLRREPDRSRPARLWNWLLDHEFRPCAERVLPHYFITYSLTSQLLWWVVPVLSTLQLIMGTAVFSSLLFVAVSDAIPIIVRYGASSVVARCIVGLELQTLKRKNRPPDVEGRKTSSPSEVAEASEMRLAPILQHVQLYAR